MKDVFINIINSTSLEVPVPKLQHNELYYSISDEIAVSEYESGLSIKYVLNGSEIYNINGRDHKVNKGQLLIVNTGSEVTCTITNRAEAFSIFIKDDVIRDILHSRHSIEPGYDRPAPVEFFEELTLNEHFNELKDYLANMRATIQLKNGHQLIATEFFYKVSEYLLLGHLKDQSLIEQFDLVKKSTKVEMLKRLTIAKNYLDETFTQAFDLDELSKVACLSKYRLIRSFKSTFGLSPNQYVIHKRFELAKSLLAQNLTASEVAMQCGFYDIHSFSRRFKNQFGVSPSLFRQSIS